MATKAELEEVLGKTADKIEQFDERQQGFEERLDAMDARQDLYQRMLKEEIRIDPAWEPIPQERYPTQYELDPNVEWVKVTPVKDGSVVVNQFKVECKKGHTMGTYTTFAQEMQLKGLVAL